MCVCGEGGGASNGRMILCTHFLFVLRKSKFSMCRGENNDAVKLEQKAGMRNIFYDARGVC